MSERERESGGSWPMRLVAVGEGFAGREWWLERREV